MATQNRTIDKRLAPARTVEAESGRNGLATGLALLAVYLIWGSTYLGIRVAIEGFPPFLMAGIRFVVAGGILYAVLRVKGVPNPTARQWRNAGLIGMLLLVGGNGGVTFAEQWVPSGLAAVSVATMPLWAALFAGLWGRWPRNLEWVGLALGLVGVVLLNLDNGMQANPLGAAVLIFAAISWAFGSTLSGHLTLPQGLMSSAVEMLVAGVALFALSLGLGEKITAPPSQQSILALIYLIVFGSLVAYSAYVYLLSHVRPTLATSYAYVNPVVAVALGALLLGEAVTPLAIAAMAVIVAGVVLVLAARGRKS